LDEPSYPLLFHTLQIIKPCNGFADFTARRESPE
jgi:hypothetical protein